MRITQGMAMLGGMIGVPMVVHLLIGDYFRYGAASDVYMTLLGIGGMACGLWFSNLVTVHEARSGGEPAQQARDAQPRVSMRRTLEALEGSRSKADLARRGLDPATFIAGQIGDEWKRLALNRHTELMLINLLRHGPEIHGRLATAHPWLDDDRDTYATIFLYAARRSILRHAQDFYDLDLYMKRQFGRTIADLDELSKALGLLPRD